MNSVNITSARKDLYKLVQQVIDSHEPVHISGKRGAAVMISEEDWRNIEATLFLTSIPGMRESILSGLQEPIEDCSPEVDW